MRLGVVGVSGALLYYLFNRNRAQSLPSTGGANATVQSGQYDDNVRRVRAAIARAESELGQSLTVTSLLRSITENDRVDGAKNSLHLSGLAADISIIGHNRIAVLGALTRAGFTGFGFYLTHIHADFGAPRTWYGSQSAREAWRQAQGAIA